MVTEVLINQITAIISAMGYPGILIMMALESMIFPVPSEAVMPFAGFLVHTGRFGFAQVVLASVAGSIIGSLLSYYAGFYGGKPFVMKFGKYFLLEEKHLDFTTDFFHKYGGAAVFASRFIPVVRHLISIPAGMGKMPLRTFLAYTIAGAGIWNAFLAYLGMKLGAGWTKIGSYSRQLDFLVVGIIVVVGIVYFLKAYGLKRKAAAA